MWFRGGLRGNYIIAVQRYILNYYQILVAFMKNIEPLGGKNCKVTTLATLNMV
jgi:hypothetical protein